ncbi:MAG: hypothetical protein HYX22_03690 [Candidatus Yanofskybacteria bacterium]|nr:hypothetical protein [Candidatus Yanofskybacteria bacterium]
MRKFIGALFVLVFVFGFTSDSYADGLVRLGMTKYASDVEGFEGQWLPGLQLGVGGGNRNIFLVGGLNTDQDYDFFVKSLHLESGYRDFRIGVGYLLGTKEFLELDKNKSDFSTWYFNASYRVGIFYVGSRLGVSEGYRDLSFGLQF